MPAPPVKQRGTSLLQSGQNTCLSCATSAKETAAAAFSAEDEIGAAEMFPFKIFATRSCAAPPLAARRTALEDDARILIR